MTVLLLLGSLLLAACGAPEAATTPGTMLGPVSRPDYWPTTAWRTATPEAQGVDSEQLLLALRSMDAAQLNLRSLTIIRNGYIVLDAYVQPFTADQAAPVFSVTKSVVSLLVGVSMHEGTLTSLQQPVLSYFPGRTFANPSPDKEAITIEDLLTMRSGLDCADSKLGVEVQDSQDWVQSILDLPMASAPGTTFTYCSRATHLLSAILTQATGMSTQAYAQSRLFDPLGITPADYSWQTDPQGVAIGGYGLSLRPHDMAKLGLLLQLGGEWEGRQVVPADWIATATRSHDEAQADKDYGYLFWVYPDAFAAEGMGDQRITVVPDKQLIVVITAAHNGDTSGKMQRWLRDDVYSAVQSGGPLPANAPAHAALQAQITRLANPVEPVAPLPAIAAGISGRRYQFHENAVGWSDIAVTFTPNSATAQVTVGTATGTESTQVGLDNVYRLSTETTGAQTAIRGRWVNDHTFVAHELVVGDIKEYDIRLAFSGDGVALHVSETVLGSLSGDLTGTAS